MICASTALCFGSIGTRCFTIVEEFHHDTYRVQEDNLRWTTRTASKVDSTLMHSLVENFLALICECVTLTREQIWRDTV